MSVLNLVTFAIFLAQLVRAFALHYVTTLSRMFRERS